MAVFLVLGTVTGCSKDDSGTPVDNNRIPQVLKDNFSLSVMETVLSRSSLREQLYNPGPYTVLAPSDEAFQKAGYGTPAAILAAGQSFIGRIANYHVLEGNYDLGKMPFLFNQEIQSYSGKLYVTRWIKNNDTVLTVNGSRLLSVGIQASNGFVQVIDRVLAPYQHELLADALAAENDLTLFYQAVQRAGMLDLLKGKGPFTVYAANNAAMKAYGYTTVQAINEADPAVLAALLQYHIAADRRFVNDYILTTGNSGVSTQGMLNNNTVMVTLVPNSSQPGSYSGITLKGTGNTSAVTLLRQDLITGNGVLHITDQVLRINQ